MPNKICGCPKDKCDCGSGCKSGQTCTCDDTCKCKKECHEPQTTTTATMPSVTTERKCVTCGSSMPSTNTGEKCTTCATPILKK